VIGEYSISGIFFSPVLLYAVIAMLVSAGVRRVLTIVGFYRLVWHRALFDFALFIILWGAAAAWIGPLIDKEGWR
jgi:protein AaeX